MAVLDIQRRGQQIGRIRIGQLVSTKDGKTRPVRLDTFRFTTQSRHGADAIAALYGGEISNWNGQYEVITTKSEIGVTVPPRDQVVSQWYEMWSKGGCQRRCDSQLEQLSGNQCLCPHAADPTDLEQVEAAAAERARLAAMNPPKACKLVTRINVMIPDLPGLGVFRLDTGSFYAAVEIGDAAALMQAAREQGVFLPAILRIEQRQRVAGGTTKKFPVPVLEVLATFREITTGQIAAAGIAAQLPPAPGEPARALAAGQPATPPQPARAAVPAAGEPPMTAQQVADEAAQALSRTQIETLAAYAKANGLAEDQICPAGGDTWEELRDYLEDLWRQLPAPGQPERGDAA